MNAFGAAVEEKIIANIMCDRKNDSTEEKINQESREQNERHQYTVPPITSQHMKYALTLSSCY